MTRQLLGWLLASTASLAAQTILPPPPVPAGNPQTPAKVLLGKALFWDEQLSSSRTIACGTCHVPANGGSDPRSITARHPGSDGVHGTPDDVHGSPGVVRQDASGLHVLDATFGLQTQVTHRHAPSTINAAYAFSLFFDGRAGSAFLDPLTQAVVLPTDAALESQAAGPPLSEGEMSHIGRSWTDIAVDIQGLTPLALASLIPTTLQQFVQGQTYAQLFQQVYGTPGVTPVRILFAIAAYERTLISDQSPYDHYLANQGTLSAQEMAGLARFQAGCVNCHTDLAPNVLIWGPVLNNFRNIGVRPVSEDVGRFAVTNLTSDRGLFRIQGLRNVALRAPYFHNGGAADLGAVIDFYNRGGDFQDNLDPFLPSLQGSISAQDRLDLIAFMQALTDIRVQYELPPFDRPRLMTEGPAHATSLGIGTAGSGGLAPRSSVNSLAYRGSNRFALGVDHTAPGAFAVLAYDFAVNSTPQVVLGQNVWLGLTPGFGLLGLPGLTQGMGPGGGYASLLLPVPSNAALSGLSMYGQWLVLDAAGPNGLSSSDALGFTVF